jgi:hypothetical protein
MRNSLLLLSAALLATVAGCQPVRDSADIQAQPYTSRLNLLGKPSGGVTGRIVFPSEFTQRSATFFIDQVRFATLPDGRFRVSDIPGGTHQVRVMVPGFEPVALQVDVSGGGEVALKPIELRMARGKVIGRLVDEQGKSASGIAVRLAPHGGATYTDQDGIFQFLGVGPGELTLRVDDPYFTPQPQRFVLERGEQRNLGNVRVGVAQAGGAGRTAEAFPGPGSSPR